MNQYFDINTIDINNWNSGTSYEQYSVVRVPSGPAIGQYLVSKLDGNNVGSGIPLARNESIGDWINFQDPNLDFADIWTPSYNTEIEFNPNILTFQFGDGYMQLSPKGINHNSIALSLVWENRSTIEIRSLLAFFEYKGSVGKFKYTLPEPFLTQKIFVGRNWKNQFIHKNQNNFSVQFLQLFDNDFES